MWYMCMAQSEVKQVYGSASERCSPATWQDDDEHMGSWGFPWILIPSPVHFLRLNLHTWFCILFDIAERYGM